MLQSISLENFKAFDKFQQVPLAPITIIVGPNSSGKSSIIQSLLLLRQSIGERRDKDNPLNFEGPLVDLGSLATITYGKNTKNPVLVGLSFNSPGGDFDKIEPRDALRGVLFEFREAATSENAMNPAELDRISYQISGSIDAKFSLKRTPRSIFRSRLIATVAQNRDVYALADKASQDSLSRYIMKTLGPEFRDLRSDFRISDDAGSRQDRVISEIVQSSLVLSEGLLPARFLPGERVQSGHLLNDNRVRYSNSKHDLYSMYRTFGLRIDTFQRFTNEIEWIVGQLYYLGPLRTPPRRVSTVRPTRRSSVGPSGEFLAEIIFQFDEAVDEINEWFEKFGIEYKFLVEQAGSAEFGHLVSLRYLDKNTSVSVSTSDLGFGIGQLMPILVEGLISQNRTICVEQPEIHLHPRLQAVLADFFLANTILRDRDQGNQWIIETHSEAMILRFLRFIAEGKLRPSDISFIYVLPPQRDFIKNEPIKGSRVRHLRVAPDGTFVDPWPDGFFSEVQEEVYSIFSAGRGPERPDAR